MPLGEPSVIVAASAPHRGEAFAGARAVIDRVKAEAPIWKVEVDGADRRRVEGTLPPGLMECGLTIGEAARAIGVSADTLRRWDRAGKLHTVRDERNRRRVPAERGRAARAAARSATRRATGCRRATASPAWCAPSRSTA